MAPKGKGYDHKGMGRMSSKPQKPSKPDGGKDYLKDYSDKDFNRGYKKP